MEVQQLVDYIAEQMRVGYSEATLREHVQSHGWSTKMVDAAFIKYHRINAAELKSARAARRKSRRKWTIFKRAKFGAAGLALVAAVVVGVNTFIIKHAPVVQAATKPLTYAQKQANDVNTVAGAVAQYTLAAGVLPTLVAANQSGGITICGSNCSAAPAVVTLSVYKPAGVLIAPYSAALKIPDQYSMYIVPQAKCADKATLGGPNTNPRSAVILYAQEDGASLLQHCVTL